MKNSILVLALILSPLIVTAHAEVSAPKKVYLHLNDVFVPEETKSNGASYVIVSGMYPDSCYSWSHAEVSHPKDFVHDIKIVVSVSGGMCLTVLVPYSKEVIVGNLTPGVHTLRFLSRDETYFERTITVR